MASSSSATKSYKIELATLLVALPITQVLAASVYMFGYGNGFGASLVEFFSIEDIFSLSLKSLAPIYITFIGAGIFVLQAEIRGKSVDIDAPKDSTPIELSKSNLIRVAKIALILGIGVQIVGVIVRNHAGYVMQVQDAFYTMAGLWIFILISRPKSDQKVPHWAIFFLLTLFTFGLIAVNGIDDGQQDRHDRYQSLARERGQCGVYVVLRRLNDNYLAVGPNNERVVVDSDCEKKIRFPPVVARWKEGQIPVWVKKVFLPANPN